METIESEVYFDLGAGWVKNKDVLQEPPLTWEYGIRGDSPTDLLASTGIATFYLDNGHSNGDGKPGLYSPDHDDLLAGFGEGTKFKIQLPGTTWLQRFYESLGVFDSIIPASWDKEVDDVADFDAEVDADGDLNDHASAAHDGSVGLRVTFDDNNLAYGEMNADAVNQTACVTTLYLNTDDLTIGAGSINFAHWIDGATDFNWILFLQESGADMTIKLGALQDGAGLLYTSTITLAAGWNRIICMFAASSAPGADDGWHRMYVGDDMEEQTGVDNDTKDWDKLRVGVVWANGAAPAGTFDFDTIKIDPSGGAFLDKLASMMGVYGISFPVMPGVDSLVSFTDLTNETLYVAECLFDLNTLSMAAGNSFVFMYGNVARVYLVYDGSNYKLWLWRSDDGGVVVEAGDTITDESHHFRLEWQASSAPGADDGYIKLYMDGEIYLSFTGLDNDTKDEDQFKFGPSSGVDVGTYGVVYFDDCKWGNTLTKVKFHGRIAAIRPDTGLFDDPAVEVEVHDWMGYLAAQELGLQSVGTTKRADQALTTALTDFPIQPEAADFDTGVETFMVIFNTDSPKSSMASFFNKMCRNELGRVYVMGDGTLRFEHRNTRAENVSEILTIDGTMTELSLQYKRRDIYNIIQARITVMEATPTADVLLWDLKVAEYFGGEIPSIAAGETIVFRCPFTDPALGGAISAIDVVDPITHVEFGSVADFESNDMIGDLDITQVVGANMTEVTMENEHVANTGYLNDLQIYGRAIMVYGLRTFEAKDTTSINSGVGERRFLLRLDHVNDDNQAQAYADHVLSQVKDSHLSPIRLKVLANQEPLLMAQLIESEVSSRFSLSESVSGIDEDFFINNLKYVQDGQQLWVTIEAGPATRYAGVLS